MGEGKIINYMELYIKFTSYVSKIQAELCTIVTILD